MPAARLPIYLDRGAAWSFTFPAVTDDSGNPVSLANDNATLTIYDGLDRESLLTLTSTAGQLVIEPAAATGVIAIDVEDGSTGAVMRTGVYLLQAVDTAGKTTDLFYGPVRIGWRGVGV